MKMNKLPTVLYLAGIVFLALAAKSWRENHNMPKPYIMVNEQFDMSIFLEIRFLNR